jgi:hypothetical protein
MAGIIKNAIKSALPEYLAKMRAGLGPTIAALILQLATWLPTTVEKVTAFLGRAYSDLTARAVAALPKAQPSLVALATKLLNWIEAQVKKL